MGFWSTFFKFIAAVVFISLLSITLATAPWSDKPMEDVEKVTYSIGLVLFQFGRFVVPFEIISLVLIAALMGAIFIAIKEVAV
ncbi:MAG: NADH-quinone oxidoreductase subunit J [Methanocellales archaeon]